MRWLDSRPEIAEIQQAVAMAFDLKVSDLKGPSRKSSISRARMIAMYLARDLLSIPYPEIGAYFGRDHSTVIHAFNKIADEMKILSNLCATIERLKRQLRPLSKHDGDRQLQFPFVEASHA